jgi:hypothetical protein
MVHRTTLSSKRNPLTRSFLVLSFLAIGGLVAACGAYPTPGMAAGAAYKTADDKKPNLESVTFSLAADELDRKKALRARFGQFWGTGKGDPRSVYDTFVSSAGHHRRRDLRADRNAARPGVVAEAVDSGA